MEFIEVSKEEFFKQIYDRKLDVHPYPGRDVTYWKFKDHTIFGKSGGYMTPDKEKYFLMKRTTW